MQGVESVEIIDVQQAKLKNYRNTKHKLLKTNASGKHTYLTNYTGRESSD